MKEGGDSHSGGFVRADQIDLKSLDEQLERHLSRALTIEKNKKKEPESTQSHDWEVDASKLIIKAVIARGTFGTVHRGIYNALDVAGLPFLSILFFLLIHFLRHLLFTTPIYLYNKLL